MQDRTSRRRWWNREHVRYGGNESNGALSLQALLSNPISHAHWTLPPPAPTALCLLPLFPVLASSLSRSRLPLFAVLTAGVTALLVPLPGSVYVPQANRNFPILVSAAKEFRGVSWIRFSHSLRHCREASTDHIINHGLGLRTQAIKKSNELKPG